MASLFENVVIEPCLLHGDLWSGNIAYDKNSEPVILDPACYCTNFLFLMIQLPFRQPRFDLTHLADGHNEAEFGMSWCAGFGESFYDAYFKVPPHTHLLKPLWLMVLFIVTQLLCLFVLTCSRWCQKKKDLRRGGICICSITTWTITTSLDQAIVPLQCRSLMVI